MGRNTELIILAAIVSVTLVSFAAFGIDTLGIIVLSMCVVYLGLLLAGDRKE